MLECGLQSALVLICLRAEGAEEEGGAVVQGVRRGRDGRHAVAGVNNDKCLWREEVCWEMKTNMMLWHLGGAYCYVVDVYVCFNRERQTCFGRQQHQLVAHWQHEALQMRCLQ